MSAKRNRELYNEDDLEKNAPSSLNSRLATSRLSLKLMKGVYLFSFLSPRVLYFFARRFFALRPEKLPLAAVFYFYFFARWFSGAAP